MQKFQVPTKPEYAKHFFDLAVNGPSETLLGICYNLSASLGREFAEEPYDYVSAFFAAIIGVDVDDGFAMYPIKYRPDYEKNQWGDGVRQRWCTLMAGACVSGTVEVPDDLMETLNKEAQHD